MPGLTDSAVLHAIKRVEQSRKEQVLADGEGRGTGRLLLVIKPMPTRVTAEWMVQQWREGKRIKSKIGSYPAMPLARARKLFERDFSQLILNKLSIKAADDTRPGTLADLFDGYIAHLRSADKSSWPQVKRTLNKIADTLGRHRPARDISP